MTPKITRRQRECYTLLEQFISENQAAPSLDWLGQALGGISKGNVHRLLAVLADRGLIRHERYGRRKIEIVPQEQSNIAA